MIKRREILEEGELKNIARTLLEPLVRNKPRKIGTKQWLEMMMGTEERTIKKYQVMERFKIPGVLHLAANVKRQGMGARMVRKGAVLFVREDVTNKISIDVEVTGSGKASGWFSMDFVEWARIQQYIRLYKRSDQTLRKL